MNGASTTVIMLISAPRDWFFYWFMTVDLSRIMHRYGILPAVVSTSDQTGPMYQAGSRRLIEFSDGTTALEEINSSDPPGSINYRVSQMTSMFRHLVREGRAQITFLQNPSGATTVEWQYTFYGHNWVATLLLKPLVPILWGGFLKSTLSRAKQLAESETPSHEL